MRKQGIGNKEIADGSRLSRETTSHWWQWYKLEGDAMLAVRKRGQKYGEQRRLNREQEKEIQKMIVDYYPNQLRLRIALW